jgi:hypothetical protein
MTNFIKRFATFALVLSVLVPTAVYAAAYDIHWNLRDDSDSSDYNYDLSPCGVGYNNFSILGIDETTYKPKCFYPGDGLQWNGTSLVVAGVPYTSIGGLAGILEDINTALSGKASSASVSTLSSSIDSLTPYISTLSLVGPTFAEMNANLSGTSTSMTIASSTIQNGLVPRASWNTLWNTVSTLASSTVATSTVQAMGAGVFDALGQATSSAATVQAYSVQRSNHTGTQPASTITGLGAVATTSSYTDLTNKPTIGRAYEGTTQRTSAFPIFKSATVSSGVAAVHLTADGTSGGTALCTNGVIKDSLTVNFNDSTNSFQWGWAWSNSDKTLTVTANRYTTANILSGILGQTAANGSVAYISVWCY